MANHIHTAPPAFDPDQHGPDASASEWTPKGAVAVALARQPDDASALRRRRQLRELGQPTEPDRGGDADRMPGDDVPTPLASDRPQRH